MRPVATRWPSMLIAIARVVLLVPVILGTNACRPRADVTTSTAAAEIEAPPLVRPSPATPAQLCERGQPRAWAILDRGEVVGQTRGRCLGREGESWHLVTQLKLAQASKPEYELHLWLTDAGNPALAELRTPLQVTEYRWEEDALHISSHGDTSSWSAPPQQSATALWVVPRHAVYLREVMLRLGLGVEAGGAVQLAHVPSRGAVIPLILRWRRDGQTLLATAEQGRFRLADAPPVKLQAIRIRDAETEAGTAIYRTIDAPPLWSPSLPAIPRPQYTLADDLRTVPVAITDDGPRLAGELVLRRDQAQAGPRPGVVFFSGFGPQDRYGFVPGTSIDVGSHAIQDALARAGFVVLRLDDPGVGGSEQSLRPRHHAVVDDAKRVVRWLMRRPEVDPRRVLLVGHGDGALLATIVARARRDRTPLAGIVLLASFGRSVRDVIRWQLRQTGATDDQVSAELAELEALHEALGAGEPLPESVSSERARLAELLDQSPRQNLREIAAPVLVLQGDKDFQVDPSLDFEPLRDAIEAGRAGGPGSAAQRFADLDHLFKPEPGRSTVGHYGDLTRAVEPAVIQRIVQWARARVAEPPSR